MAAGLFAYGLWRKLSPAQRRLLLEAARTHGPKVAAAARTHGPKVCGCRRGGGQPLDARASALDQAAGATPSATRTMRSCSIWCAVG